jgi:hypothetical protein
LDAAKRGADFWGQIGGGVVHGATDKVMGKTAAKTAKNRGIGATIEYGNDRVYQEGAKNVNNRLRKNQN